MKAVKYYVLLLLLIAWSSGFVEGQEEKYVIHIKYGLGLDTTEIHSTLDAELESALIATGKYKHLSSGLSPTVKVDISIQSKEIDPRARESQPSHSAIGVAYCFFPESINYYAYSNCHLIENEANLKLLARIIEIELRKIYELHYDKALDMHKAYSQYTKTQDKK